MKEYPIIFTIEMVREILSGNKTQTRRVIRPQPGDLIRWNPILLNGYGGWTDEHGKPMPCPYGDVGDRLWVRETWRCEELDENGLDGVLYAADGHFEPIPNTQEAADLWIKANRQGRKWRPSIFMPKWASRISLEVVSVSVQGIQQISEMDAQAEGIHLYSEDIDLVNSYADKYRFLWDDLNARRGFGWIVNPWVWVIEFELMEDK